MGATLTFKGGKHGASALVSYVNRHGDLPREHIYTYDLSADNKCAQAQLSATRRLWGNRGKVQAFHWVQSFDEKFDKDDPADVERAHEVGSRLVDEIAKRYPDHEIYMGTHTDSESGFIHNHIVVGSVNGETGKKLNVRKEVMYEFQDMNDKVLGEFGIEQPKEKFRDIDYQMHSEGKTSNREQMKHMVIDARKGSHDFESFKETLKERHGVEVYEFGGGKRIGYKWTDNEGKEFTIGARKLGADFERPAIEKGFEKEKDKDKARPKGETFRPHVSASVGELRNVIDNSIRQEERRKRESERRQAEERQDEYESSRRSTSRSNEWDMER